MNEHPTKEKGGSRSASPQRYQTVLLNIFVRITAIGLDFFDDVSSALTVTIFMKSNRAGNPGQRLFHIVQIISCYFGIEAVVLFHGMDNGAHALDIHQSPDRRRHFTITGLVVRNEALGYGVRQNVRGRNIDNVCPLSSRTGQLDEVRIVISVAANEIGVNA